MTLSVDVGALDRFAGTAPSRADDVDAAGRRMVVQVPTDAYGRVPFVSSSTADAHAGAAAASMAVMTAITGALERVGEQVRADAVRYRAAEDEASARVRGLR